MLNQTPRPAQPLPPSDLLNHKSCYASGWWEARPNADNQRTGMA